MEKLLGQLVNKMQKAHGDDLVSVILYGSAAQPGEHDPEFSDINVLCVLREVTPVQLVNGQPVLEWWRAFETPAPLLLSESEVKRSADCFAIEFRDMQQRRKVLAGRDVIAELDVPSASYRNQIEYELRTKLLRLRTRAAALMADPKLLSRLLVDSVTTFSLLARHALLAVGADPPPHRRPALQMAEQRFGLDATSFYRLLDIREKKTKASSLRARDILDEYLRQINKLIDAVDRPEAEAAAGTRGDA